MFTQALPSARTKALTALLLAVIIGGILPAFGASDASSPFVSTPAAIEGIGKATAPLSGPWQFHLGDNPAWAFPAFNDATGQDGWEQIAVDKPWGAQGHFAYYGYAWYRRRVDVTPVPVSRA